MPKNLIKHLAEQLTKSIFKVTGKNTYKDKFVAYRGVALKEINFKTMESKIYPGIYFEGEGLDMDGVAGGLNF